MNLIIDENLPPNWCDLLIESGYGAQHWQEIGRHGDPDEVIFDYAQAREAVILTQDMDFTRIAALRGSRLPSIIQLRDDCPIPAIMGAAVLAVLTSHGKALKEGALVSLDMGRSRIRLMPLQ